VHPFMIWLENFRDRIKNVRVNRFGVGTATRTRIALRYSNSRQMLSPAINDMWLVWRKLYYVMFALWHGPSDRRQ